MSNEVLRTCRALLEGLAAGGGAAELQPQLEALERLADPGDAGEVAVLRQRIDEVTRSLRDRGVAEKGLSFLIDTVHDLSSTLELEELLRLIVSRARNLAGANVAWLTLIDEETGIFRTATAEGHVSPAIASMTSQAEYGAVGLIMRSKSFFDTQDYLDDRRFRHSEVLDAIFVQENIVSLAGFPILSEGEVCGFLFVADRYGRKLTGPEISVLGSFALHAGVAMRNARAFRLLSEALNEAQRNRNSLIAHIRQVESAAAAHDELTTLLASGAELSLFLQRMARRIDAGILLYDASFRVQEQFVPEGYRGVLAQGIRDGTVDSTRLAVAHAQSRRTGRTVQAVEAPGEICRVIALHAGPDSHAAARSQGLAICHLGELDEIEVRNLERSVVALSIAKLWNEKRETERVIASSTLLRHLALVAPPDAASISAVRDRLGLAGGQDVTAVLIAIEGMDRGVQTGLLRDLAARRDILVDLVDETYFAIGAEPEIREFLKTITRRSYGAAGGILSAPFDDLSTTPERYARMNRALQILRRMGRLSRFVDDAEVSLFARMFETGDEARLTRYLRDTLSAIEEGAPRNPGQLKATLLSYFDNQHNARRTAEALGIHVNTMRQRLDSLKEITGGWDDPVTGLELHVALKIDAILGGTAAPR